MQRNAARLWVHALLSCVAVSSAFIVAGNPHAIPGGPSVISGHTSLGAVQPQQRLRGGGRASMSSVGMQHNADEAPESKPKQRKTDFSKITHSTFQVSGKGKTLDQCVPFSPLRPRCTVLICVRCGQIQDGHEAGEWRFTQRRVDDRPSRAQVCRNA